MLNENNLNDDEFLKKVDNETFIKDLHTYTSKNIFDYSHKNLALRIQGITEKNKDDLICKIAKFLYLYDAKEIKLTLDVKIHIEELLNIMMLRGILNPMYELAEEHEI